MADFFVGCVQFVVVIGSVAGVVIATIAIVRFSLQAIYSLLWD